MADRDVMDPVEPVEAVELESTDERPLSRRARVEALVRRLDPPQVLLVVGVAGIAIGLVAIYLAWYGASGTVREVEQIPYLISGGLTGAVFSILGALMVGVAVWLFAVREQERGLARREAERLAVLERLLEHAAGNGLAATSNGAPRYVTTRAGKLVHRPDCRIAVSSAQVQPVVDVAAYEPCQICQPFEGTPGAGRTASSRLASARR